jgi:ATP-binding protein involved in chromosome partitioning
MSGWRPPPVPPDVRYALPEVSLKSYHDIKGDGGSNVLQQVIDLEGRIQANLAGVRRIVAIGSGKGGVGKSTLTFHLAALLKARGAAVALLDADINGPSQARLGGVQATVPLPAQDGRLALPRGRAGFGVFSLGSLIPESQAVDFESVSRGAAHTWRATREFTLLSEVLERAVWGTLDALFVDLPPGAERITQFADLLGPRAGFVLVTIPSDLARGVVARSLAALRARGRSVIGLVENMDGYACSGCHEVKPLFRHDATAPALDVPTLGSVPFDPELARLCDAGIPVSEHPDLPSFAALTAVASKLERLL